MGAGVAQRLRARGGAVKRLHPADREAIAGEVARQVLAGLRAAASAAGATLTPSTTTEDPCPAPGLAIEFSAPTPTGQDGESSWSEQAAAELLAASRRRRKPPAPRESGREGEGER